MKISTKMGDNGTSSLFNRKKFKKNHVFFECLGAIDEIIAEIGLFVSIHKNSKTDTELKRILDDLYRISAILGFEFERPNTIRDIGREDLVFLEKSMADFMSFVPKTTKFVKYFNAIEAAQLNVLRTKVRKVERIFISVLELGYKHEYIQKYLNRLSDLIFVYALFYEKDFDLEIFK